MWIGRYRLLDGRQPWIASEYVTGRTLQATVEEGEPDPGGFAVSVGVASASAADGWFEATFDNYSIWMQP
jgi:hypothetical protein